MIVLFSSRNHVNIWWSPPHKNSKLYTMINVLAKFAGKKDNFHHFLESFNVSGFPASFITRLPTTLPHFRSLLVSGVVAVVAWLIQRKWWIHHVLTALLSLAWKFKMWEVSCSHAIYSSWPPSWVTLRKFSVPCLREYLWYLWLENLVIQCQEVPEQFRNIFTTPYSWDPWHCANFETWSCGHDHS